MSTDNQPQPEKNTSASIFIPEERPINNDSGDTSTSSTTKEKKYFLSKLKSFPLISNIFSSSPQKYNEEADDQVEVKGIPKFDIKEPSHKDKTASDLASIIVSTFAWSIRFSFIVAILHFGVVFGSFIASDANNEKEFPSINESMEIFKTVSAVMSGPIGFVFGFYFRENNR